MADEIYIKTGDLSSELLRKVIHKAENAYKKAKSAGEEACYWNHRWSWGGKDYWLFSANAKGLISDAESELRNARAMIEKLAAILDSGPDDMQEIDRKYKSDLKDWRKSGNHGDLLWIVGGGATAGAVSISFEKQAHREVSINDYSAGVSRGNIRYVNQYHVYNESNGWREEHRDGRSDRQCNWACESMAFSYLGIDQPPSSMHDSETLIKFELAKGANDGYSASFEAVDGTATVEVHSNGWGASFDREYLDSLVQNYVNDGGRGCQSPVMMHYSDGSNMHWILIIGNNNDGTYRAIGPWSDPNGLNEQLEFNVAISDSGVVSGTGFSSCDKGGRVDCIGQYTRTK